MSDTPQQIFKKILQSDWKSEGKALWELSKRSLEGVDLFLSVSETENEMILTISGKYDIDGYGDILIVNVNRFFSSQNTEKIVLVNIERFSSKFPVHLTDTLRNGVPLRCHISIRASNLESVKFPGDYPIEKIEVVRNSKMANFSIRSNINEVILKDSKIEKFDILGASKYLCLGNNLEIGEIITLEQNGRSLFSDTVLEVSPYFSIQKNAFARYKTLGRIARESGDKTSAHTLYVKELQEFKKLQSTDRDSWWLITIGDILNKNGTSFVQPILWFININIYFVLAMTIWGVCQTDNTELWKYLFDFQILGTSGEVLNETPVLFAINNTRKLLLVIITSQVILSSARFRFSFK